MNVRGFELLSIGPHAQRMAVTSRFELCNRVF